MFVCIVLAFCVLANVYIVQICIIDGALSMFSKRGYVPDIRPRECIKKYCPLRGISQYTPKGAGMSCHSISSLLPVNIKKYIPTV